MSEIYFGDIYFPGMAAIMFIVGLGHGLGFWKLKFFDYVLGCIVTLLWPLGAGIALICLLLSPFALAAFLIGRSVKSVLSLKHKIRTARLRYA